MEEAEESEAFHLSIRSLLLAPTPQLPGGEGWTGMLRGRGVFFFLVELWAGKDCREGELGFCLWGAPSPQRGSSEVEETYTQHLLSIPQSPFLSMISLFLATLLWGGSAVKNPPDHAGDAVSIPGSVRFPREGNGNPFQYFCLRNPMGRGAWQATVHGIAKSQT